MSQTTVAIARTFLSRHLPQELVDKILKDVYEDIRKLIMLQIGVRKFNASVWHEPSDRLVSMCREPGSIQTGVEVYLNTGQMYPSQIKYIEPWMLWSNYNEFRSFAYKQQVPYLNNCMTDNHIETTWKNWCLCSYGCTMCEESFPCINAFIQKIPGTRWSSRNLSCKIDRLWSGKYYGTGYIQDIIE